MRARAKTEMTPEQIAEARALRPGSVRVGASLLVYIPEAVPDYGPWPIDDSDDREFSGSVEKMKYMRAISKKVAEEVRRRRRLFGRVHRVDPDVPRFVGYGDRGVLTACLRVRAPTVYERKRLENEWIDEESVFATDVESDVACAECLAVIAHLRAAERARRGLS